MLGLSSRIWLWHVRGRLVVVLNFQSRFMYTSKKWSFIHLCQFLLKKKISSSKATFVIVKTWQIENLMLIFYHLVSQYNYFPTSRCEILATLNYICKDVVLKLFQHNCFILARIWSSWSTKLTLVAWYSLLHELRQILWQLLHLVVMIAHMFIFLVPFGQVLSKANSLHIFSSRLVYSTSSSFVWGL